MYHRSGNVKSREEKSNKVKRNRVAGRKHCFKSDGHERVVLFDFSLLCSLSHTLHLKCVMWLWCLQDGPSFLAFANHAPGWFLPTDSEGACVTYKSKWPK